MPDPFGIKCNSTPPAGMARYMVSFHAVPKPHPAFKSYSGAWTPEQGLVKIFASSDRFEDEPSCQSSRELYERVKRQLTQVYGQPELTEFIGTDAIWPQDDEFYSSLSHGERSHSCSWLDMQRLDAGIQQIHLMVVSEETYDTSYVMLSYCFAGHEEGKPSDEYGLDSL